MHDCSVATGDRFLSSLIPRCCARPRGLLLLTWDQGSSGAGCCQLASGGHVATILAGPGAKRGAQLTTPADHYSLLHTVQDVLGVGRLRNAACACTPWLKPLLGEG
jgi:hypothetical protein